MEGQGTGTLRQCCWAGESGGPLWATEVNRKLSCTRVGTGGPARALAPALVLPLRDGESHVLQPFFVGLRGADLGDNWAEQFVHQLQHLVSILLKFLKIKEKIK